MCLLPPLKIIGITTINDNKMDKDWLDMTILEIIGEYKEGDNTPLDGDEVYRLSQIIKTKINLQEGNILQGEYEKELDNI